MTRKAMAILVGMLVLSAACNSAGSVLFPRMRYRQTQRKLREAKSEELRFYALGPAAKSACDVGEKEQAKQEADELLSLATKYPKDWNYGNAVHDGNVVLGRIALEQGDVAGASRHLIDAGKTPGSPQLNSFGPNMTLARDLIAHHQLPVVLNYFKECRVFWKMDDGKLTAWSKMVEAGRMPSFGANLLY